MSARLDYTWVVVVVSITIEALIYGIIYLKRKHKIRFFSSHDGSEEGHMSGPQDMFQISNVLQTLPPRQRELSLPGFLQFELNTDFVTKKQIAKGGSAAIFKSEIVSEDMLKVSNNCSQCIVKRMFCGEQSNSELKASFSQEVSLMWYFHRYPNFVKLYGFSLPSMVIVMKYYELGALSHILHKSTAIEWNTELMVRIAHNIADGLLVMHRHSVIHCDVKPENILIDRDENGNLIAVLSDLGIAKIVSPTAMNVVKSFKIVKILGASAPFSAPEVFLQMRNDPKGIESLPVDVLRAGDVFAFAVTLWEIITRKRAWKGIKTWEDIELRVVAGERLEFPDNISEQIAKDNILSELVRIVSQSWCHDPRSRMTFPSILNSLEEIAAQEKIVLVATPPSPNMEMLDSFV